MITCANCGYSGNSQIALDIDGSPTEICPECEMII